VKGSSSRFCRSKTEARPVAIEFQVANGKAHSYMFRYDALITVGSDKRGLITVEHEATPHVHFGTVSHYSTRRMGIFVTPSPTDVCI
jgi:hypothetical protein